MVSGIVSQGNEVSTGNVLIRGNLFDQVCTGSSDCGCVIFAGSGGSGTGLWKNILVTENVCQNSFGWSRTCYHRDMYPYYGECGFAGYGFYIDTGSGIVFYRNIAYNIAQTTFLSNYIYVGNQQLSYVNNLIVSDIKGFSITGYTDKQEGFITIKNNIIVDEAYIGMMISTDKYDKYDKFEVNNNLYYNIGYNASGTGGVAGIYSNANKKWNYLRTFDDLHSQLPTWETTEYSFNPNYKKFPSQYDHKDVNYSKRMFVSYFDDGVFDVTPALEDKGSSTLPQPVQDVLKFFGIPDVKTGSNYDLGPFEKGVKSWIPSSKKDLNRSKYSPEEPVVSSAYSLCLSISSLLACFLFLILF